MPLGMEVGLDPSDFVFNGDPARRLNFRPIFIIVIVISLEHCTGVRRYVFKQPEPNSARRAWIEHRLVTDGGTDGRTS